MERQKFPPLKFTVTKTKPFIDTEVTKGAGDLIENCHVINLAVDIRTNKLPQN